MSAGLIERPDTALVGALHPSPNIEPRCGHYASGAPPRILLLHYTGVATAAKAIDWLARPESRVSCHYVIDEAGLITQMVAEAHRAWHAGAACWEGETDINSASIGIEIQNAGHDMGYPDFPAAQMRSVAALSRDIVARHGMRPEGALAHSDVAPARKIDPGEKFDWRGLARVGVGHWVEPVPVDATDAAGPGAVPRSIGPETVGDEVVRAQSLLRRYGYGIEPSGRHDRASVQVVAAFQRHFRPARVDGRIDPSTLATLELLLAALPPPALV